VNNIINTIKGNDPVERAYSDEYNHSFLSFCSFVCLLKNKKLNLPNIFLVMLQDDNIRAIFKELSDIESDYDALKKFLEYDAGLYKSKYIKNFLEDNNFTLKS
jgi:hypothetical protein